MSKRYTNRDIMERLESLDAANHKRAIAVSALFLAISVSISSLYTYYATEDRVFLSLSVWIIIATFIGLMASVKRRK